MSFPQDVNQAGIANAQDQDLTVPLEIRAMRFARRVLSRDEWGEYVSEEDSLGDIEPNIVLWKRAGKTDRPYSAWAPAFAAVTVQDPKAGVSTGGNSCPVAPGYGGSVLPVGDESFRGDARFERKDPARPKRDGKTLLPKSPTGQVGIVMAALLEDVQQDLFLPTDNRLVAVNFNGDPDMGTRVYDLNDKFEYDPDRWARLQSAWRVIKKPRGGPNMLAWQINRSGCEDSPGGLVADAASRDEVILALVHRQFGGPFDVGQVGDKHSQGEDADGNRIHSLHFQTETLFRRNALFDGPLLFEGIYPGADGGPHKLRTHLTFDGTVWRWYTESPIYTVPLPLPTPVPSIDPKPFPFDQGPTRPGTFPLPFAPGPEITSQTQIQSIIQDTPFQSEADIIDKLGEALDAHGVFELIAHYIEFGGTWPQEDIDLLTPEQKIQLKWLIDHYNLVHPERVPFFGNPEIQTPRVSPTSWSNLPIQVVATNSTFASPVVAARPQNFDAASDDLRSATPNITDDQISKVDSETPITGTMCAYGAQGGAVPAGGYTDMISFEGDPWHYTQRPGSSKYPGGTANGGWFIFPPEVGPEDRASGYAPTSVTKSTTYFGVAPGAYFAAGTPETANGSVATGYSWGIESATGDLLFRAHPNTTLPVTVVRFSNSGQNISWYSGAGFQGIFDHANTADRTYTFPNKSGTVAMLSDIGTGVAALFTATTTVTYSGSGSDTTLVAGGSGSMTLTANYLTVGKTVRLTARGYYTTGVAPGNLNIKVTVGGAVFGQTGSTALPISASNRLWKVELHFTCYTTGVGGSAWSQGDFLHMETAGASGVPTLWELVRTATQGVDTTSTNLVDLLANFDTAGNSIVMTNLILEGIN